VPPAARNRSNRAGEHAFAEYIEMLGRHHARLFHVKIMDLGRIDVGKRCRENIACFWLSPSGQTRSPGPITACRKFDKSAASTVLPRCVPASVGEAFR
jgi:hypothetical protein